MSALLGENNMSDIVKVQLPISISDPAFANLALVYEEGRKRVVHQPLEKVTRIAMGDDVKAFFHAQFSEGRWVIGRRVKDRDW